MPAILERFQTKNQKRQDDARRTYEKFMGRLATGADLKVGDESKLAETIGQLGLSTDQVETDVSDAKRIAELRAELKTGDAELPALIKTVNEATAYLSGKAAAERRRPIEEAEREAMQSRAKANAAIRKFTDAERELAELDPPPFEASMTKVILRTNIPEQHRPGYHTIEPRTIDRLWFRLRVTASYSGQVMRLFPQERLPVTRCEDDPAFKEIRIHGDLYASVRAQLVNAVGRDEPLARQLMEVFQAVETQVPVIEIETDE